MRTFFQAALLLLLAGSGPRAAAQAGAAPSRPPAADTTTDRVRIFSRRYWQDAAASAWTGTRDSLRSAAQRVAARDEASISRTPVADAATVRARLFSLPAGDSNIFFRVDLPGDNFLLVRFDRLRYWQAGTLPDIVAAAAAAWTGVRDSFRSATAARKLAVHLPPAGYPAVASFREWGADEPTVLLKGARVQPLRIASDTLVVLKTFAAVGTGTGTGTAPQIEYTLLLKDLGDVEDLAANTPLLADISATFDSLVAATGHHWKRPDAAYHHLKAQYDLRNGTGPAATLRAIRWGDVRDRFDYNGEIGASVLSGILASAISLRLSYYFHAKEQSKQYVALSVSALSLVSEGANNSLVFRSLSFLNIETGGVFSNASGAVPLYRTSLGLGYRIDARNEGPYDFRYRAFFNYSVSKALTVTPEFYSNLKKEGKGGAGAYGITVSIKLF